MSKGVERLAFFNPDGGLAAWNLAERFAGPGGRVATLPDIVDARLAAGPGTAASERYYTTSTAEYSGRTAGGVHVLVVAHGIGPMADREGIVRAYSWSSEGNEDRSKRGGAIPRADFLRLLDGAWGEVAVVDLKAYAHLYKYPLMGGLTRSQAEADPLAAARVGGRERLSRYLDQLASEDDELAAREACRLRPGETVEGRILRIEDDANNGYLTWRGEDRVPRELPDGMAMAGLLTIAQPVEMSEQRGRASVQVQIDVHGWNHSARFCGWRAGAAPGDIPEDDSVAWARKARPDLLLAGKDDGPEPRLRALTRSDGQWFAQRPKEGSGLDTADPMYPVEAIVPVGEPVEFSTTIGGYHGFFKYDIGEVEALAPAGANAYAFAGPVGFNDACTHHVRRVQFYAAVIDTGRRLYSKAEVAADPELAMRLVEARLAA